MPPRLCSSIARRSLAVIRDARDDLDLHCLLLVAEQAGLDDRAGHGADEVLLDDRADHVILLAVPDHDGPLEDVVIGAAGFTQDRADVVQALPGLLGRIGRVLRIGQPPPGLAGYEQQRPEPDGVGRAAYPGRPDLARWRADHFFFPGHGLVSSRLSEPGHRRWRRPATGLGGWSARAWATAAGGSRAGSRRRRS